MNMGWILAIILVAAGIVYFIAKTKGITFESILKKAKAKQETLTVIPTEAPIVKKKIIKAGNLDELSMILMYFRADTKKLNKAVSDAIGALIIGSKDPLDPQKVDYILESYFGDNATDKLSAILNYTASLDMRAAFKAAREKYDYGDRERYYDRQWSVLECLNNLCIDYAKESDSGTVLYAKILNNIANIEWSIQGQCRYEDKRSIERPIELFGKSRSELGVNNPEACKPYLNMAQLYLFNKDYKMAAQCARSSVVIARRESCEMPLREEIYNVYVAYLSESGLKQIAKYIIRTDDVIVVPDEASRADLEKIE